MKTPSIVRRIDDLGRIVIPKEIRKSLRIKNGDSLEIYIENENVILQKHSEISLSDDLITNMLDAVNSILQKDILVCDNDKIIKTTKKYQKEVDKTIENELIEIINKRKITDIKYNNEEATIFPIISSGDIVGALIIIGKITDLDKTVGKIVSSFFMKYIEQ